jgi:hypothetical protein
MKNREHPTDKLLREAMDGYQITPSDAARKSFLKDASALPPARNNKHGIIILFSALAAFAIFGLATWQIMKQEDHATSTMVQGENKTKKLQPLVKTTEIAEPKKRVEPEISQKSNSEIKRQKVETTIPATEASSSLKIIEPITERSDARPIPTEPVNENKAIQLSDKVAEPVAEIQEPSPIPASRNLPDNPSVQPTEAVKDSVEVRKIQPDTNKNVIPAEIKSFEKHIRHEGKFTPSLGAYYTPEWMFNTLEGVKFVHNFGIEGIFNYGPFSIRTGAGLSIAKGTNELSVEYNEYLGTYNKLDSMDFTWSNPSQQYMPSFYMSRQDVWDSLLKLDNAKIVKRYTYLQIPLIFGYTFFERDRVSAGFRIGPQLSVLVATKQLSADYDAGKNKIIRINDVSPGQINLNWQMMAGINGTMRLTEVLKFEVEPFVRYYFNSVYEMPANHAKPWSVGVRAAFLIGL